MASSSVVAQQPNRNRDTVRRFFSFPVACGCLLLLAVLFKSIEIAEPDMWWHLKNADHIFRTHSLPRVDQYSFTASGAPWMDHEWASEILFYIAYRAWGLRGVLLLYVSVSMIIFTGLYYISCRKGANPKNAAIVMSLGIVVASVSFGPRTLLFGWLWMVVLLGILQRFTATRSGPLWLIPLLFGVWINFHGSWLFGMIVLGIFIVSGLVQGECGLISAVRWIPSEFKKLAIVAALSVAALFANPFGYKLVAYPFDMMFRQQTMVNTMEEWLSVDFHDPRGKPVMIMLVGILAAAAVSRRRWSLSDALLAGFALYAGLMYSRMQFFTALICVPLLATRFELLPPYDERKEKPILNAFLIFAVLAVVLFRFPSESELNNRVRQKFPEAALSYMKANHINGRIFNEYGWGGYIIWRTSEIKTFIDGRADLFVYNGVYDDYLAVAGIQKSLEVLDRYGIQYALLARQTPPAYLLGHQACWREIYSDDIAVLYKREETAGLNCRLKVTSNGGTQGAAADRGARARVADKARSVGDFPIF